MRPAGWIAALSLAASLLSAAAACSRSSGSPGATGSPGDAGTAPADAGADGVPGDDGGSSTLKPAPPGAIVCDAGPPSTVVPAPTPATLLPAACAVAAPQACSPVDGTGCPAGQTCDLAIDGTFQCYEGPATAVLGAPCDGRAGPFCGVGLTCAGPVGAQTCAKVCCADTDCAQGQTCQALSLTGESASTVGACQGTVDLSSDPAIGDHPAHLQGRGRIVPWTTWQDALDREQQWFSACPMVASFPSFASVSHVDDQCAPSANDTIPAMQDGFGVLSYLKAYVRGGRTDASLLATAKALGDYLSTEALTPSGGAWPRFPRSTGLAGATPQPADAGSQGDLPFEIEPDKGGIAGVALMQLSDETGDPSYASVALDAAHTLAANMVQGDASHSPWPFRVDYRTGQARPIMLVSGDMAYVLRLFDLLLAKGHTELQAPRDALWSWIKGFQIPNARCDGLLWVQFFEDMTWWYDRTAWAPLSLAGYLLEGQATLDPDWATDVQILLDFVAANFVPVQNGYPVCVEQDIDQIPYGGVFSTYGAVLARHASVTGSLDSRMKAYQALELLLFSIGTNGCPAEKPFSTGCGGWIEDVHLDKIHNFEDALTLFPTWQ